MANDKTEELAVPVIDVGALVALQLDADFRPSEYDIDELHKLVAAFFILSKYIKDGVRRAAHNSREYFDDELTKNKLDWKEVFDFGWPLEDKAVQTNGYQLLDQDQNRWLDDATLPGFRTTMQQYYKRPVTYLDRFLTLENGEPESSSLLRSKHYPASPDPDNIMSVYHHTDSGELTVLFQDDRVTSLQVFHRGAQEWVIVPPRKGTYVIYIGDILQAWSNDRFPSAASSRAVERNGARVSVPFFYHPPYTADVGPILQEKKVTPK